MTEWEDELMCSEKIFIRASTHGKKSFWGYDGAVLHKSDERIRTFPFPTRRPVSLSSPWYDRQLTYSTDAAGVAEMLARAHSCQSVSPIGRSARGAG